MAAAKVSATSKAKAKAIPKPTADKDLPSAADKLKAQKKASDTFRYRLERADDDVKSEWDKLKSRPKTDVERERLFEAIKNVEKGDYSECKMIVTTSISREIGIHYIEIPSPNRWFARVSQPLVRSCLLRSRSAAGLETPNMLIFLAHILYPSRSRVRLNTYISA